MLIALFVATLSGAPAHAQKGLPVVVATPVGADQVIFEGPKQGCDPNDIPDAPLRAVRLADGRIAAFGLHFDNRRLVGSSFTTLKLECSVVFRGTGNATPERFDDRIWIAATHTRDGQRIEALGHAEYHGEAHPGRCPHKDNLKCLWVSVIGLVSEDGGQSFQRLPAPVAVPGMKAEAEMGRHRGFFNPTNIITHKGAEHFLVAQTGWNGQPFGVCLFRRTGNGWRAWDGNGFNTAFPNPYDSGFAPQGACKPLPPFLLVPGSVTKHRASGLWLAIFPGHKGGSDMRGGTLPTSGFYLAASRDLIEWSAPTMVMETPLLGERPCGQPAVATYPTLIDEAAEGRNFDNVGDVAQLAFTRITAKGCDLIHERRIVLKRLRITALPAQ